MLAKFLGILEPRALEDQVDSCVSERTCREVWDLLRDKQILSWNGFVKRPLLSSDLHSEANSGEVGVVPPSSELQLLHLLKVFCRGDGISNPKKLVEELVKLRLQIDSYRSSSLEDLLAS